MTIDVFVVGLNEIGASIARVMGGLGEDVIVTGFDLNPRTARSARKDGVIDRSASDLVKPSRTADLVFVALPSSQVPDVLARIAPELKEGAILFDLAPLKGAYIQEALGLFSTATYVGAVPALNPEVLPTDPADATGRTDLFEDGVMALVISPKTSEEVVDRIMGVVQLLGAEPYFVDAGEVDGMMAVVREVPLLASAAYLHSLTVEPGWKEAQRLAGREFFSLGRLSAMDAPAETAAELLQNKTVVLHRLQNLVNSLQQLQTAISGDDRAGIEEMFEDAGSMFTAWQGIRKDAGWQRSAQSTVELPQRNLLGALLGIRPRTRK